LKLDRVKLNRKYNLGNYETLDVGFEAETTEQDNPLDVLKGLEDLAELYLQSRTMKPESSKPEKKETPQPTKQQANNLLEQFPPDYRSYLSVKDNKIFIKFVSKEKWTEINQVAKGLGYEWISAGKDSHWRKK